MLSYLYENNSIVKRAGCIAGELRDRDRIRTGQQFSIERVEAGEYVLRKLTVSENVGLAEWLLACPEKGWFQPLASELTDSIAAGHK